MREHLRIANLVTSANVGAGFAALLVLPDRRLLALALVLLAAALDVVDGALARRAGGGTVFGAQLDSLADLLCFCVVPAYALAGVAGGGTAVATAAVGGGFVLAGAWRLARFPLVKRQDCFVGLPTPAAGLGLLVLVLWAPLLLALAGGVLLAVLMVGGLPFPSLLAAAATVRHPGRHGRRSLSRVRRLRVGRPRLVRPRSLHRPRRDPPVGHPDAGRRRRAVARAGRLLHVVRGASGRRR